MKSESNQACNAELAFKIFPAEEKEAEFFNRRSKFFKKNKNTTVFCLFVREE